MSKTEKNLKKAFVRESQANLRYIFFSEMADELGYPEVADMFRSIAKGEECHAKGHLFFLQKIGSIKVSNVKNTLKISIKEETDETENMYPKIAKEAREEGHEDIAKWIENVGKAESRHLKACKKLLDSLE
jgi:rubrerythrin